MQAQIRTLVHERTRVLAAIAHDLQTYLTRLCLRAEFIDDAEHRAKAARDLDEMTALINDTLFLAGARRRLAPSPSGSWSARRSRLAPWATAWKSSSRRTGPAFPPTWLRVTLRYRRLDWSDAWSSGVRAFSVYGRRSFVLRWGVPLS